MSRSARLLFYAINGTGLGHITRLVALARETRDLLHALDARAQIAFITTSDAPQIADPFPVYKIPSKQSVARGDFAVRDYTAFAKLLVSNLAGSLRPDVLVLDTIPEGSFAEFSFLRSYAHSTAFVDRHRDEAVSQSDIQKKHIALYDRVLVPDHESAADRYPASAVIAERRRFISPVHNVRPSSCFSRERARELLGVPPDRHLVYITGGGGADGRELLDKAIGALREDPSLTLAVGYGPLHRGPVLRGPHIIPLTEPDVWRYFAGMDAAVSAAGYNTYQELLAASVPSVFYAQPKQMDRQDERVRLGVERGWHLSWSPPFDASLLRAHVHTLISDPEPVVTALSSRPPSRGASRGAVELVQLAVASGGRAGDISPEEVFEAAQLLQASQSRNADFEQADDPRASIVRTTRVWQRSALSPTTAALQRQQHVADWHTSTISDVTSTSLVFGKRLDEVRCQSNWDHGQLERWLRAYADGSTDPHNTHSRGRSSSAVTSRGELERALPALADAAGPNLRALLETLQQRVRRVDMRSVVRHLAASVDAAGDVDQRNLITSLIAATAHDGSTASGEWSLTDVERWLAEQLSTSSARTPSSPEEARPGEAGSEASPGEDNHAHQR